MQVMQVTMIKSWGYNRFDQFPSHSSSTTSSYICHNFSSTLLLSDNGVLKLYGFEAARCKFEGVKIVSCALGLDHALVVSDKGAVASWGTNTYHQLGRSNVSTECSGSQSNASELTPVSFASLMVSSALLNGHKIVSVTAGDYHSVLLSGEGTVFGFGKGVGSEPRILLPSKDLQVGATRIACGAQHTAAILTDGRVATWGWGGYGQLGHGKTEDEEHPKTVGTIDRLLEEDVRADEIACGSWHTACVMSYPMEFLYTLYFVDCNSDGSAYTWGWGGFGQLGQGNDKGATEPTMVEDIDEDILHVACGSRHTILASEKSVYTFGYNQWGQLVDAEELEKKVFSPVRIEMKKKINNVFAGGWTTSVVFYNED